MEHRRVLAAIDAIAAREWRELGRLFTESHESLRALFDVSCDELDELVDAAQCCQGVEGARLTGAGFGGAVIALVWPDAVAHTIEAVRRRFAQRFGRNPAAFVAEARGGAAELT
jgi:galactokinase